MTIETGLAIDANDLRRVETEAEMAAAAGFTLAPPIYTLGTPVNETGIANYAKSRADFEALPLLAMAATLAAGRIRAEERRDVPVTLGMLGMQPDGTLRRKGSAAKGAPLSPVAFRQLLDRSSCPVRAASYLESCPPSLRSVNVNHWLEASDADKVLVARTRKEANGTPGIFALVSPEYSPCDADTLVEAFAQKVPQGARGEITYDGTRFQAQALYHSDIAPSSAVAGELFKGAVILDTRDDGMGGVRCRAAIWRNLCLNLIIIDVASTAAASTIHRGNVLAKVGEMVAEASKAIEGFAERWNLATRDRLISGIGESGARETFTKLVDAGLVHVPNVDGEDMVGRLVTAWNAEPGYTRSSVVNAITRAAHSNPWASPWVTESLEEQAGALLYQTVQVLDVGSYAGALEIN